MHINSILDISTELVKKWGDTRLTNGIALSKFLTLNSINYWEVYSVELARVYIPEKILNKCNRVYRDKLKILLLVYFNKLHLLRLSLINKLFAHKNNNIPRLGNKIAFLGFQVYIFKDVLLPICEYIGANNDNQIPVVVNNGLWTEDFFTQSGTKLNVLNLFDYYNERTAESLKFVVAELKSKAKYLLDSGEMRKVVDGCGNFEYSHVCTVFERFLKFEIFKIALNALLADEFINKQSPSIVISPDLADPRNRVFTEICKSRNIPSLEIQFGLTEAEGIEWRFFNANRVASWGAVSKNELIKHGISDELITITGSPRHDRLLNINNDLIVNLREEFGISPGMHVVVVASTYVLDNYDDGSDLQIFSEMMSLIVEAAGKFKNIYLVIKPHPKEAHSSFERVVRKNKYVTIAEKGYDIKMLIQMAECFISFGSTSTADAIISHKQVVCPCFSTWVWSDMFINTGCVHAPRTYEDILSIFESISGSEKLDTPDIERNKKNFIKRYAYKADGNSSMRVSKLIDTMMFDA